MIRRTSAAPLFSASLVALTAIAGCDAPLGDRPDGSVPRTDAAGTDAPGADVPVIDPDGGVPDTCPSIDGDALVFDGADDGVTMGRAAELGLARFTVEAWVRRDGEGRAGGTGVGGLSLVPIAGKGRGESDGSNVDCNYAFGFFGDVLGADFEDMASGANHPVVGRTAIPFGEWHHVAATYDGTTWRLYLDGVLDGQSAARATPRADSIQHFGIGRMYDSTGVAAGAFDGAIDEVRVWDRARSAADIAGARFSTAPTGEGLLARWSLDDDGGGMATDAVGGFDGTITGSVYQSPGATLDHGAPPGAVVVAPMADAVVAGASAELRVAIDGEASGARFFVRSIEEDDDFSVVVLPDTQYYASGPGGRHPDSERRFFGDQTRWVMANRADYDIRAVIHNGDIVDDGSNAAQWTVATDAMGLLEAESADLPDGMPYGMGVGNHDSNPRFTHDRTEAFNARFGVDRFAGRAYYGGHYGDDNDENWITFDAGGLEFVVVSLQWTPDRPDAAVTTWARRVFESHPDAFGIVNSHWILGSDGNFGPPGQAMYNALANTRNVHLMTCGHIASERRRSDTSASGHTITSMLADYQGRADGGGGRLRLWEFSPMNDELTVRSYSPSSDTWETDAESEFTLRVDLSGAGGEFEEVAALTAPGDDARASISVEAGVIYEWYAEIEACGHRVRTAPARFTATP